MATARGSQWTTAVLHELVVLLAVAQDVHLELLTREAGISPNCLLCYESSTPKTEEFLGVICDDALHVAYDRDLVLKRDRDISAAYASNGVRENFEKHVC